MKLTKAEIISLVIKSIVIIASTIGVILCTISRPGSFMAGPRAFLYFTIQSNIGVDFMCILGLILMLKHKDLGKISAICKLVGTVSITLTGFVFCFVLAPVLGAKAWTIESVLTHVVVPFGSIADFFIIGRKYSYTKLEVLYIAIPPLLYTIFAGVGYASNWNFGDNENYPYFFLNWGSEAKAFGFSKELPFMGCVWWIIVLLLFILGVGYLYRKLLELLNKKLSPSN